MEIFQSSPKWNITNIAMARAAATVIHKNMIPIKNTNHVFVSLKLVLLAKGNLPLSLPC